MIVRWVGNVDRMEKIGVLSKFQQINLQERNL
jgi:hypothetical protein